MSNALALVTFLESEIRRHETELQDVRAKLTQSILETNTVRAETARAELERDRLSTELEQVRSDLADEQRARLIAERGRHDADEAHREAVDTLASFRLLMRDAF